MTLALFALFALFAQAVLAVVRTRLARQLATTPTPPPGSAAETAKGGPLQQAATPLPAPARNTQSLAAFRRQRRAQEGRGPRRGPTATPSTT